MEQTSIKNSFLLFLAAFIWGVAFVAQSVGMDYMGPATFDSVRFLIGGMVLLPFIWIRERGKKEKEPLTSRERKLLWSGGGACGLALCAASLMQQYGILYTTVGKAGFITTLYIVIVPILGIFVKKRVAGKVWIGAGIAVAGMYLLCMSGGFSISKGDFLVLICAVLFSFHILLVDYFAPKIDSVKLSCIQFFVSGGIAGIIALLTEEPRFEALIAGAVPVLYAGIFSCGIAYTLQVVGQKNVDPTIASLLLSLESVISVLAGWALLGEKLSPRELFGCALVFAAVILVQLPERKKEAEVRSAALGIEE